MSVISREAAIDEFYGVKVNEGYYCAEHDIGYGEKWELTVNDRSDFAISKLSVLPSASLEQRWIPVSERLPEDGTEVFVYLFDPQCPYIAWVTDSCWFTEDFQVEKENYPKAWMPLPKPWEGK